MRMVTPPERCRGGELRPGCSRAEYLRQAAGMYWAFGKERLLLHVGGASSFEGCLNLDEGVVRFLQGEPPSEGLDEGVGILDLEAVHQPAGVLRGDYKALALGGILVPAKAGEDVFAVLHLRYDGVVVALEISGFRNVLLPKDFNDRGFLLFDV